MAAVPRDPFDHPDISAMDLRQLADLPAPGFAAHSMAAASEPDVAIRDDRIPLPRCA